ncbi:MAG: deoxyribonuclease V [Chloroflexota bacterium]
MTVQDTLRYQISRYDQFDTVKTVAGVDVGFEDDGKITRAAVVVLDFPSLMVRETAVSHLPTSMPYIPGLLSFREIPAVLDALSSLKITPDLLLCDGQGIAHPRRLGLAAHLGLLADIPSIGVAKTRFIGKHGDLEEEKGAIQPLMDKGEQIGVVLRSRTGVKPLYISVGHRISLDTAVDYVLRCTPKYRLPETTRQAHKLASNL